MKPPRAKPNKLQLLGHANGFTLFRDEPERRVIGFDRQEAVNLADALLRRIDQGEAMGVVMRWAHRTKPVPPRMIQNPKP